MTKFEEEAKEKILNTSRLYIAHEGAHADVDKGGGIALKIKDVVYVFPWLEFARNWHSDEEFQELLDKYSNLNDHYEKEVIKSSKLESQIIGLKSQLQQQALPVVPECVAEWYEEHKDDLEHGIYSINVSLDKTAIGELTDVERWFNDVSNEPNETIFIMKRLGYQVEKPQLFYLKNKLTTSYLALDTNTGYYEHWGEEIIPKSPIKQGYKIAFTQAEIDSMQTGSYEQIEVAE